MDGYTTGGIPLLDINPRHEAFFYYPHPNDPVDWGRPWVIDVTRLADHIEKEMIERQPPEGTPWDLRGELCPGIQITPLDIDAAFAQRALDTGAAEKPLVANARRMIEREGLDRHMIMYAGKSPFGVDPILGTLIDGMHRYVAAWQLGHKELLSVIVREPILERFRIAGVSYRMVKMALGSGPDDTSRHDWEVRTGRRNADGSISQ